jgi:signal transduction histidine kinase
LAGLLVFSGLWATASVVRLLPIPPPFQQFFYTVGLITGLGTVGAWLYFCSAYTGRSYHRNTRLRRLAFGLFLFVVAVKLTNPLHQLYFTAQVSDEPFRHLSIDLLTVHWVVTGVSYALTAVGLSFLYELFNRSNHSTTRLNTLLVIIGSPALLDVVAYSNVLQVAVLKFNYEPVGVAVFAVGTLFVVDDEFLTVPQFWREQILNRLNEGVIIVDTEGAIRDTNDTATQLLPRLDGTHGRELASILPRFTVEETTGSGIVEVPTAETSRYFALKQASLVAGSDRGEYALIFTDVTQIERQRRELQRQNEQFDALVTALNHELGNATTVLSGHLELLSDRIERQSTGGDDIPDGGNAALQRMQDVIDKLSVLAQYGRSVEELEPCDLSAAVAFGADAVGMEYSVRSGGEIYADKYRLRELFRNFCEYAEANGATSVSVSVSENSLIVQADTDEGLRKPSERAFEYGDPAPGDTGGMTLPNVQTLAESLRWDVEVGGVSRAEICLRISGIETLGDD